MPVLFGPPRLSSSFSSPGPPADCGERERKSKKDTEERVIQRERQRE